MNLISRIIVIALGFIAFGVASLLFILRGDDDIASKTRGRRPTSDEAIRRIMYVLSMLFTLIFGGSLLAIIIKIYILLPYHLIDFRKISHNQNIEFIWICI